MESLKRNLAPVATLAVLFWAVFLVDMLLAGSLKGFGIRPRDMGGLTGIAFSPFLHGGIGHIVANTIPFLVLGGLVALRGVDNFVRVSLFVAVVGGGLVWLFGSRGVHIGASGLVFGYAGYLVARGWVERSARAVAVAALVLFLYGGLLWGVLPIYRGVSWEGHLFGMLAGIGAAFFFRKEPTPGAP